MFNLRGDNHEVMLTSERYTTKQKALEGIDSVKINAPHDPRYRRLTSTAQKPYFTLTAANNQVIGTSETYSSAAARDNGIEAVKKGAPSAPVKDNT
ncbi:MAG: YegP family protein [Hydrogenophaga sp.]|uniref:YegP family protein n=1 Tax=unclassified Hydrogenophaga TaxID=2610897 RepID=UPI00257B854A|nr:YegP family protein [Hydrogenophaga sp.]MBL0943552.1 YegP family protein [Hydrogenophaga sp.]